MNPWPLVRWTVAAIVAAGMTLGSLALVAWMNDDPSPTLHEQAHGGPRPVPVLPPPTPPSAREMTTDPAMASASPTTTPAPSVAPPAPAPPQIAGLAPSAGPGTLPLGSGGGALPSMGTLPGSELTADQAQGQSTPARPKSRPKPRYPRLAQRQGIEGYVTLRLRIDADGRVEDAVVVTAEPPGVFDDAAIQTARLYRFTPARRGAAPISTTLEQTIRFELQQ